MSRRAAGRFRNILAGIGLGIASLLIAAGVFAQSTAFGDLASHFLPHFAFGALVAAVIAARRTIRFASLAVVAVAMFHLAASPGRMPWHSFDVSACAPVKILSSNLNRANRQVDGISRGLAEHGPDVAVYFEVTPRLAEALARIAAAGGYRMISDPRDGFYGSAVLTKLPVADVEFRAIGEGAPKLSAWLRAGDWRIRLGGVHLGFPLSSVGRAIHKAETGEIGEFVRTWRANGEMSGEVSGRASGGTGDGALVLIGDFNATPWSWTGAEIFRSTALGDQVPVFPGTWPTFLPAWLGIPIDQAFVTGNAAVLSAAVLDNSGSDHRAILLTIAPKVC